MTSALRFANRLTLRMVAFALLGVTTLSAGENYAFLVAVGDYDRTELKPLKYTRPDIVQFRKSLLASGYRDNCVVLLHDDPDSPPKTRFLSLAARIRSELELLLGSLEKDDTLIVAFAGHGVQFSGEAESYFCPNDARLKDRSTLIAFAEVLKRMDACPAGRKLLLVDACRNTPQTELARSRAEVNLESVTRPQALETPKSLLAFFSCGPGQQSFEDPELGHGIFFHHLLKGWDGAADKDGDGQLEFSELETYVRRETKEYARLSLRVLQTPQLKGERSDEWILRHLKTTRRADKPVDPATDLPKLAGVAAGTRPGQEWDGNGLKMKFCWCPSGSFLIGSHPLEPDRLADEDRQTVQLTGFWMGKTEVTQAEWNQVMKSTLNEQRSKAKSTTDAGVGPDHPMHYISHHDSIAFVRELTKLERAAGRLPADWEYRLPTEAEWEYACRAGGQSRFHFGDDDKSLEQFAWFGKNSGDRTHPVGLKRPNAWGLCDMHGNVCEWCRDRFGALPQGKDPVTNVGGTDHVARSGNWGYQSERCRAANRFKIEPTRRDEQLGMRVTLARVATK